MTTSAHPQRLAELRPGGVNPTLRDVQLGTTDTMTWSYPVIFKGLVYVADNNQGLLVLRYAGPHQVEVSALAFSEEQRQPGVGGCPAAPAPTPALRAAPSASSTPLAESKTEGWPPAKLLPVVVWPSAVAVVALLAVVVIHQSVGSPADAEPEPSEGCVTNPGPTSSRVLGAPVGPQRKEEAGWCRPPLC